MTEHAWVQEQIAAFLADGLDAAELERFRTHVRECAECTTAVDAAKAFDAGLANLFASARPGPMLEDRTVRGLRTPTTLVTPGRGVWRRRVVTGLAASLLFGGLAAGGAFLVANGGLPMPGEGFSWRGSKPSDAIAESVVDQTENSSIDSSLGRFKPTDRGYGHVSSLGGEEEKKLDLTNIDKGLDSELAASLPVDTNDFTNGTVPNATTWSDNSRYTREKQTNVNGRPADGAPHNLGPTVAPLRLRREGEIHRRDTRCDRRRTHLCRTSGRRGRSVRPEVLLRNPNGRQAD